MNIYSNGLRTNPKDSNVYRNGDGTSIIRPLWGRIVFPSKFCYKHKISSGLNQNFSETVIDWKDGESNDYHKKGHKKTPLQGQRLLPSFHLRNHELMQR